MRIRIAVFATVVQAILFLVHWVVYETWTSFWGAADPRGMGKLEVTMVLLSISFVTASLVAFRYSHILARLFYRIAAVWLGVISFFFLAACSCWVVYGAAALMGLHLERRPLAGALFGLAILATLYGIINAARMRVRRVTVRLPNLPASWRGRLAALVSDTHLGHVRGYRFARRIGAMLQRARPDVVFLGGDLYDGAGADLDRLAKPWAELEAPLGAFFVAGNHEEIRGRAKYLDAIGRHGIRVLNNEKVTLDGMQIVGVHWSEARNAQRFQTILRQAALDRGRASILLTHAPDHLPIAEQEGVSLQLSGHTHGGQFFPFTWITGRIYGRYVYGLNRWGNLLVYTSSGAGTWGPPLRVGTQPEIVLIRFE